MLSLPKDTKGKGKKGKWCCVNSWTAPFVGLSDQQRTSCFPFTFLLRFCGYDRFCRLMWSPFNFSALVHPFWYLSSQGTNDYVHHSVQVDYCQAGGHLSTLWSLTGLRNPGDLDRISSPGSRQMKKKRPGSYDVWGTAYVLTFCWNRTCSAVLVELKVEWEQYRIECLYKSSDVLAYSKNLVPFCSLCLL